MATRKAPAKKVPVKKAPAKKAADKAPPADVTRVAQALFAQAARRRKAEAALAVEKEKETELREDLLALFGKKKVNGLTLPQGSVSMVRTTYAVVEDLEALKAFAKKKGNGDLLSLNLSSPAWRERVNAGITVPGVKEDYREDLRVTPAKK